MKDIHTALKRHQKRDDVENNNNNKITKTADDYIISFLFLSQAKADTCVLHLTNKNLFR